MTRRLVAGTGWKMNMTVADTRAYADELRRLAPGLPMHDVDCFVLPPFTSLHAAHTALAGLPVAIGGQTMHWEASGAWTGEVSAPMLLEAGCRYVELAHSERRAHFGETYELVRRKVNAALSFGLTPILCIGETAEDKRLGCADAVLAEQVATALADQGAECIPDVVLAYEPRWAIGAAAAATPDYVAARHQALRTLVEGRFGPDAALRTRIIYGGSVTPANGRDLVSIIDVDGLFVGRAAWSPEGFAAIIALVGEAAREGRMSDRLLTYYGDDLTGSTDVMEGLASNGVPTVLFLRRPGPDGLARFASCRAIGLAGTSRSETPDWMEAHLPDAFAWLKSLGAPIVHYKVCSTFDSSPAIGSIGRAAEIGLRVLGARMVPLVVGAPQIRRYTAFGTLFAAFRGEVYRIDRHPVMSRHPVTPMGEADLRLHLAAQTAMPVALVDLAALLRPDADSVVDVASEKGGSILLLDVADSATQQAAGRQLRRLQEKGQAFVVGSSGVEYALVAEWRRTGLVPGPQAFPAVPPVERIAIVSGSCSPTTERQIRHAGGEGFDTVALDPRRLASADRATAMDEAVGAGLASLSQGRSVILHTALGPSTDLGAEIDAETGGRHAVGEALGEILKALVERQRLTRAAIAGGDTSSHALQRLGVEALTTRMPILASPGSPLCVAHAPGASQDGLEVALKGGQIGEDDYFVRLRDGRLA